MYIFIDPYDVLNVLLAFPDNNSVEEGKTVMTLVPETSLTIYIMSPTDFVVGSGRVNAVAKVPVIATISVNTSIEWVVTRGPTAIRVFTDINDKLPESSVLRTCPEEGVDDGHVNEPIWRLDADDIVDVTTASLVIVPDIYSHMVM